jgi:Tfp pilus assembly protein PilN
MKVILTVLMLAAMVTAQDKPRVYLQSQSKGNTWNSQRDQSIEMAKDFNKNCPDVRISVLQNTADYTVILNHIEVGPFGRDNQMEVANKNGDLLTTREKGGIKGGVKAVCQIILADWEKTKPQQAAAAPAAPAADAQAQDQAAPQAEPTTVQLGETADQVRAAMGAPEKVVNLGDKQIYVYKDLKITFVSEKVADVQ